MNNNVSYSPDKASLGPLLKSNNHESNRHENSKREDKKVMEARVAKLESDVEHIKNALSDIKVDLRSATADVASINTKLVLLTEKLDNIGSSMTKSVDEEKINHKFEILQKELEATQAKIEGKLGSVQLKTVLWIVVLVLGLPSLFFTVYRILLSVSPDIFR